LITSIRIETLIQSTEIIENNRIHQIANRI